MKRFGLIGFPLGHSFSAGYFAEKFSREHIDATYENFPMSSLDGLRHAAFAASGAGASDHSAHLPETAGINPDKKIPSTGVGGILFCFTLRTRLRGSRGSC